MTVRVPNPDLIIWKKRLVAVCRSYTPRIGLVAAHMPEDAFWSDAWHEQVRRFQTRAHLEVTGQFSKETRDEIRRILKSRPPAGHPSPNWPIPYAGIDVYNGDGSIDWTAVKRDSKQIRFVWAKEAEGTSFSDVQWQANLAGARSVGIPVGGYTYLHTGSIGYLEAQADFFLSRLERDARRDLRPAYDWEAPGASSPAQRPGLERVAAITKSRTGVYPMLYGSAFTFAALQVPASSVLRLCPLWIAAYPHLPPTPAPWTGVAVHQWAGDEARITVDGIDRQAVDINKSFVPLNVLRGA